MTELLKKGVRPNVTGPVVIPQRNKFKNHALWVRSRNKSKGTKRTSEANDQDENVRRENTGSETSTSTDAVPVPTTSGTSNFIQNSSVSLSQSSGVVESQSELMNPYSYFHHPASHSLVLNSTNDTNLQYFGLPH